MRIKALSATVANQIAAGEVIENPASVVKELLENALDAGASSIAIDIGFGGLNQIKISDNGIGIIAEDLPLAVAPHATSKLTVLSDLSTLTSMGFRGEALASIASISRLSIRSKPLQQEHAMLLQVDENGMKISPCARNVGTTIDVRDLFYNAPVRRRFLRSERSEFLAIEQVVKRFALSAPEIALVLKHNEKIVLELPAALHEQSLRVRIQRLLGKAFLDSAVSLDVERAGMHLTGWVSDLNYQRSQNDKQWIYLNQRMVKDKLIQHAIKQAYETKLHPGKYPACLLYLSIPTQEVDVNVHPTKHEVRFQQPRLVHDFIGSQITQALVCEQNIPLMSRMVEAEVVSVEQDSIYQVSQWVVDAPTPPLMVKEQYIARPHAMVVPSALSGDVLWMSINQHYGLINWQEKRYLFHIQRAQQQQCLSLLHHTHQPLASRPLLVPVTIEHQVADVDELQQYLCLWMPFGLRLEADKSKVTIRTIPVCMPQLLIQALLHRIVETMPSGEDMLNMLVGCQSFDAAQWRADEKAALGDYIIQQLEQNATIQSWCVELDVARCDEMMND